MKVKGLGEGLLIGKVCFKHSVKGIVDVASCVVDAAP